MIPLIILAIENDDDRELMIGIYEKLYPMMKSTAYKVVKNEDIAEDMVHETITNLIDKLETIKDLERKRLVSYIKKSVYNNSINYYNKRKNEEKHVSYGLEYDFAESIPDDSCSSTEHLEILEEYEELAKIMRRLPEREREILYLKYNMQYDDETIGKTMGIKKECVRQYLTRARRVAKEYIVKEGAIIE